MGAITLPEVPPYFAAPKLSYAAIQRLQILLQTDVSWLDRAYHIARIGVDAEGETTYPQIYMNAGNDEHKDIRPDDSCQAYCFFEEDQPYRIDHINGEVTYYLSVIFWCNLKLIDPAKTYDYTSTLINDVVTVLKTVINTDILVEERPGLIFNNYKALREDANQFLMRRYSAFKLSFSVTDLYTDECVDDPVSSCDLFVAKFNALSDSDQTCVTAAICECPNPEDADVEVNGEAYDTVVSGGVLDIPVVNTDATPVGIVNAGVNVVVPDATVTIKNSANTTIDSGSVASGASATFTIADSTAVIKNSAGTTLQTEAIPAEVSENIIIADTAVSNSDDSYTSVVISGVAKELPDITYTDALGVAAAYPSVKNLTATRVNAMTCAQLNGELTVAQRQFIQRVEPIKTGQTASFRTGDDGDFEYGNQSSFYVLTCNNPFGNTNRFTDELGGQTFTNNLVCDWANNRMWYRVVASGTWAAAIDACLASTQGGYDDWYLPNIKEYMEVFDFGLSAGALTYTAFNSPSFSTGNHWSSTTHASTTANAVSPTSAGSWQSITKTFTRQYLMVRKMT